jgi:conjugal transfer mating pair stabilization protein TraN
MGSPKNPQCDGLPLGQLENLDWSQIDLSEWTALLQEEGALKTGPGNLNIEALTGSGHALSLGQDPWGERDNVLERTQDRLGTGSVDDTRMHHNQNFYFNPD